MGAYDVEVVSLGNGRPTALGSSGPFTLVVDRPVEGGGGGLGFNGAELVAHVDRIAEIPNSLRRGTAVRIGLGAR